MLKHQAVINKLTPEQKLKLVISSQALRRDRIDEFDFRTVSVEKNPFSGRSGYFTHFPQYKALATTWNTNLIQLTGKYSAIENNSLLNGKIFDLTFSDQKSRATEDCFYNGKFVASFLEGVNSGNGLSCISLNTDDCENFENKMAIFNYAISQNPSIVVVNNLDDVRFLKTQTNYKNLIFANSSTKESTISLIQSGACLVFVQQEDFDGIIEHGLTALNSFAKAEFDLNNGSIDSAQFAVICESGEALSEERLNKACDDIIEIIFRIDDAYNNSAVEPLVKYYQREHKVVFDEILHNNLALESARQSVVLLKNENVLPIKRGKKVCVIGDYVKNDNYIKAMSGRGETIVDLVFDRINDYEEIDTVGYVHGYLKGLPVDEELIRKAKKLTLQSDIALVFLAAQKGENTLPESQLKLLSVLQETGKEIVAIVITENLVDLSFSDLCSGIVFAYNGGQNLNKAILDVISGRISPSGKMVESSTIEGADNIPFYSNNESKFPFGFGLSYTKFNYINPEINSSGVSVTIENVGNYDAYETVQLYVTKSGSRRSLSSKHLKGFVKVFVEKGQKQRVFIPFDDNTFNVYNQELACYMIEGGNYTLFIGDSSANAKIVSSIKVKRFLNKTLFKNRVIAHDNDKLVDSQIGKVAQSADHQSIIKKNLFLTPGNKVGLSIFFLLYVNLLCGLLLFDHFRKTSIIVIDKFTFIVGCVDIFVSLICIICFFVYVAKRRKPKFAPVTLVNDTLTQIIDRVGLFNQESKVTYLQEVLPDENVEEQALPVVEEQEEIVESLNFTLNSTNEEEQLENTYSIGDLYDKYTAFIRSKGLLVEPFAIRSVLASILSTNIVFINASNKENLRRFVLATQEFFSCEKEIFEIQHNFNDVTKLLVSDFDGQKAPSTFAVNLNKACSSNKLSILALAGASISNISNYLGDFIRFNDNPSVPRSIKVGDSIDIKLKNNCVLFVLPAEDDNTENMPDFLSKSTISLNISIRENTEEFAYDYDPMVLSYADLMDQVLDARSSNFIPEEHWKHFDELEDLIFEKENLIFGNKITIFAEKFSSIFMECHGEYYEAIDALISYKYLPILKSLAFYKQTSGDFELTNLLEKVFGKENLDKSLREIKKIERVSENVVDEIDSTKLSDDLVQNDSIENKDLSENSDLDLNIKESNETNEVNATLKEQENVDSVEEKPLKEEE